MPDKIKMIKGKNGGLCLESDDISRIDGLHVHSYVVQRANALRTWAKPY